MDNKVKMKVISTDSIKMKLNESEKINLDINVGGKEVDPIFRNSPAYNITNADITYWNNKSNFSGSYNDLTNKPIIPTRTSQLTNDSGYITKAVSNLENYTLTNALANVAISGDYDDLLDKPSIPTDTSDLTNNAGFVTSDTSDLENYTLTSNLAEVATTGQYGDLLNTPELANVATSGQYSDLLNKPTLAAVASTGDYDDLTNKPTIPTKTSELTNDSGYITNANIPTKTSDLTNDSGFITNSVNDLTNYTLSSSLAAVATSGSYNDLINKPTIVESGSNANGNYIKYEDGSMICYGYYINTLNITSTFEGVYYANTGTITFPIEFYSTPCIYSQISLAGAGFTFYGYTKTSFSGFIWKIQSKTSAGVEMPWLAIGRWKA